MTTASKSLRSRCAIGPGAADEREHLVFAHLARGDLGDDLLRQHVERTRWHGEAIELAAVDAVEERGALDELIAREREQTSLRRAVDRVAGTADALQERRDRARRPKLADEIDVADVDAELERGGGDERFQLAVFQTLFGVEAFFLRQAAVMRADMFFAEAIGELAADALDETSRVDEDERGAVGFDELRQAVIDELPHLGRHHAFERRGRNLDREIAFARVAGVDDGAFGGGIAARIGADEEARDLFDRLLRGGESDAQQTDAARARPRRSSEIARCEPRLLGASAWISSTITVRVVDSIARPDSEPRRM